MNYSPEICIETLTFLSDYLHASYPRVMQITDQGIKDLKSMSDQEAYDYFKHCLIRISNIVGHKTIQRLLMQPKNQTKRDLCTYIHGSSHIDKCFDRKCERRECKIARDIRVHVDKKQNNELNCKMLCSTCILLKEIARYQMKKVILNARYGIGEPGCVDFVDHVSRCQKPACMERYKAFSCDAIKRFLSHERQCVDVECSCFYIDPILRYSEKVADDMPRLESFDELTDLVLISGFDENELKKESLPEFSKPVVVKKRRVMSKEELYVMSFGLTELN